MEPRLSREIRLPRFKSYSISEATLGSDICSICKNREKCMRIINDVLRKLGVTSFTLIVHTCSNFKPARKTKEPIAI